MVIVFFEAVALVFGPMCTVDQEFIPVFAGALTRYLGVPQTVTGLFKHGRARLPIVKITAQRYGGGIVIVIAEKNSVSPDARRKIIFTIKKMRLFQTLFDR